MDLAEKVMRSLTESSFVPDEYTLSAFIKFAINRRNVSEGAADGAANCQAFRSAHCGHLACWTLDREIDAIGSAPAVRRSAGGQVHDATNAGDH